jgi:hypothetical protein
MALFSPVFSFKDVLAVKDPTRISPENARVYFAANHRFDARLANEWRTTHLGRSIQWVESKTHGTLEHLVYSNKFQTLAHWLAGQGE